MEILDTLVLNIVPQKPIFPYEEVIKAASEIRRFLSGNPDARCTQLLNLFSNHLATPGIKEQLEVTLADARHTTGTMEAERRARAALDNYKPLFPTKIKIVRRRKAKLKTKLNVVIRIDPELARLAVTTNRSPTFRLWAIMRDGIRQAAAAGKADNFVTTAWLTDALKSAGITYTPAAVRKLRTDGQKHGFWNIHNDRMYIASYKRVAAILTRRANQRGIPLDQDRPGARDWYTRISGEIIEFNAYCYAAWLASNKNPTISRQTLMGAWNRTRQQLQKWERITKIKVTQNYAQTTEIEDTRIPEHAVSGNIRQSAESTTIGYRWQRPNTYQPKNIREHGHKGQARKVRKAVNAVCDTELHPDSMAGAHRLGVRNFDTLEAYKAAWRRDSRTDVPLDAHTDYLHLGDVRIRRRGKLIRTWELMGAHREPQTSAGDYEPMPRYMRAQYGYF